MGELDHLGPLLDMMAGTSTADLIAAVKPEPFDDFLRDPESSIVVSGSRIEGISNPVSDLDLYILAAEDPRDVAAPIIHMGPGFYTDAEIVTYAAIDALEESVHVAASDSAALASLTRTDLDNYYRLSIAIPVFGEDAARERLSSLSKDCCSEVFASWCAVRAHACLGAIDEFATMPSAEERTVYLTARLAFEWAIDSWLASHGEAFPSRKWRFEKLERLVGDDRSFFDTAWRLKAAGDRSIREYVSEIAELVPELVGNAPPDAIPYVQAKNLTAFEIAGRSHVVARDGSLYEVSSRGRGLIQRLSKRTALSTLSGGADGAETRRLLDDLVCGGLAGPVELGLDLPGQAPNRPDKPRNEGRNRESTETPVSLLPLSVADYVDRLSEGARLAAAVGGMEFDLLGALAVGQYGMAFVAAHDALVHGAAAAIVRELGTMGALAEPHSLVPLMRVAGLLGTQDARIKLADELSRRNPITESECREFVEDCLAAVREFGLLSSSKWHGEDGSNNFLESSKEISAVAAAFGMRGQLDEMFDVDSVRDDQRIDLDI
jgi:hypothetical protein